MFVLALSKLVELPNDVTVDPGGDVTLPCRAEGQPEPRIFWERLPLSTAQHQDHEMNAQPTGK